MVFVVMAIGVLGYVVTPNDSDGHPLLLLPDVRNAQKYKWAVHRWVDDLHQLDGEIEQILQQENMDLLTNARQGQDAFEEAVKLLQEMDKTEVPPTAIGERNRLSAVAASYFDAANAALRWISAPTEENKLAAEDLLKSARLALLELEKDSAWMNK